MVSVQITILFATIIVSLFSLVGILALSLRDEALHKILFYLIAFSAGTILGTALFELLPEAVEHIEGSVVFVYVAGGFVAFYFLERFIYWYHGHGHHSELSEHGAEQYTKGFAYLNVLGDGIHNFLDGMIIAVSFNVDFSVGLATTIAVAELERPDCFLDLELDAPAQAAASEHRVSIPRAAPPPPPCPPGSRDRRPRRPGP